MRMNDFIESPKSNNNVDGNGDVGRRMSRIRNSAGPSQFQSHSHQQFQPATSASASSSKDQSNPKKDTQLLQQVFKPLQFQLDEVIQRPLLGLLEQDWVCLNLLVESISADLFNLLPLVLLRLSNSVHFLFLQIPNGERKMKVRGGSRKPSELAPPQSQSDTPTSQSSDQYFKTSIDDFSEEELLTAIEKRRRLKAQREGGEGGLSRC